MNLQTDYVNALRQKCQADERVLAFWLEGSLGKNAGDAFSDVDAHLLVRQADLPAFRQNARVFLEETAPLVLFRSMFDGEMINALTSGGLRLDIWTHSDAEPIIRHPEAAALVWERTPSRITWDTDTALRSAPPANAADLALRYINEFWRCISILPSVLGRGEKIVAIFGFFAELSPLTELLILSTGVSRDTGVKHLNRFLPPEAQAEIEAALDFQGLSLQSLANAHLALANVMQKRGPGIAAQFGVSYPADLEAAALRYVEAELAAILND